jgi:hypothetical protein
MSKLKSAGTAERRAHVRYAHALRTTCRPLGQEGGATWAARVCDVSRTGVALLMGRGVMPGSVLVVALEGLGGRFSRPLLMRVVRARAEGAGTWAVGCTFVTPLADEEVQSLLLAGDPPEPAQTENSSIGVTAMRPPKQTSTSDPEARRRP